MALLLSQVGPSNGALSPPRGGQRRLVHHIGPGVPGRRRPGQGLAAHSFSLAMLKRESASAGFAVWSSNFFAVAPAPHAVAVLCTPGEATPRGQSLSIVDALSDVLDRDDVGGQCPDLPVKTSQRESGKADANQGGGRYVPASRPRLYFPPVMVPGFPLATTA